MRTVALLLALLLASSAWADSNKYQTQLVPLFTAAPTQDCDMVPNSGGAPLMATSGAWTAQYIGYHRGSVGTVTAWGPCVLQQYVGVRECHVEFLTPVPSNCTLPNITIEQSSSASGGFNTVTTWTGGTPPATTYYDHRDPLGPVIRASLASDITDTDCDSGGVGVLDLVVVCGY